MFEQRKLMMMLWIVEVTGMWTLVLRNMGGASWKLPRKMMLRKSRRKRMLTCQALQY